MDHHCGITPFIEISDVIERVSEKTFWKIYLTLPAH